MMVVVPTTSWLSCFSFVHSSTRFRERCEMPTIAIERREVQERPIWGPNAERPGLGSRKRRTGSGIQNGTIFMNLSLNLTEQELSEIRLRTDAADDAEAICRAAREYLRVCQSRELTAMAADLDYDENAWRELDVAELGEPHVEIELDRDIHG